MASDTKGRAKAATLGSLNKLSSAVLALALAAGARGSGLSERVVVVANSDAPDSVAIAQHYAKVRGVPPGNVIELRMPVAETITCFLPS